MTPTRPLTFAVVGDPVAHSKSPAMHEAAYRALDMPHRYEAIRATARELPSLVEAMRRGDYAGFNVTVPHKAAILPLVDEVRPGAALAHAANTLRMTADGAIEAHNTDIAALAVELRLLVPEREPGRDSTCIVLGSGGAARAAVLAALHELGCGRVVVKARAAEDGERRRALEADLRALAAHARQGAVVDVRPLSPDARVDATATWIVQATSAGMSGASPGDAVAGAVAWEAVSPSAAVFDVVYAPRETVLLATAREHGLRHANGLGMLARQGALAFELWLGVPAPFHAMLAAIQ